jgi:hypothetical protein
LIWMISSLKCPPGKRLRSRGMNQTSPNKATQKESMPTWREPSLKRHGRALESIYGKS